jgi:hypothetical protein
LVECLYRLAYFEMGRRNTQGRSTVMASARLTEEQERQAQELEIKIRLVFDREAKALARLLVSKADKDLFGNTEFEVRDRLLRVGASVYEEHLREKKTATKAPR